jgi:hypothetical protein
MGRREGEELPKFDLKFTLSIFLRKICDFHKNRFSFLKTGSVDNGQYSLCVAAKNENARLLDRESGLFCSITLKHIRFLRN